MLKSMGITCIWYVMHYLGFVKMVLFVLHCIVLFVLCFGDL